MKKSLIFAGMLAVGYANAQYEGKVGVNTETPKATLEVQPSTANLTGTTNEGLLIPRLSKERVAKMASPETSTLVYVNEATTYTTGTDTAADTRVAKIDAVGFYHYNGTQWVKHLDTDTNDTEWVYDAATNRINLKRSGTGTMANSVFYDANTGQYIDTDSEDQIPDTAYSDAYGYSNENVKLTDLSMAKTMSFSLSSNLKARTDKKNGQTLKGLNYHRMNIVEGDNTNHFRGNHYDLLVPEGNTQNYSTVYGDVSFTSLYGSGTIGTNIGQWGQLNIGNQQSIGGYATAMLGSTAVRTTGTIANLYATYNRNVLVSPAPGATISTLAAGNFDNVHLANDYTLVTNSYGIRNINSNNSQNTGTGTSLFGFYNAVRQIGKTKYPAMYGIYTATLVGSTSTKPTNLYGLYIADVTGGETLNRAIHTGTGKIRFGDLADASATADRVVTVDKDGVLKTGEAVTNTVKLATTTSVTCDATTTGTMNFGTVNINGKDTEAFGFCMKNSAGEYKWYYIYGGAGITTGSGAFGTGL